jgi:hypothetical protein
MQTTWFIIMGISIRVGIDMARYAALRAQRQPNDGGRTVGKESASPNAATVGRQALVADLPAAPLAYRSTWADEVAPDRRRLEQAAQFIPWHSLACDWTLDDSIATRTMHANHLEFVS